MIPEVTVIYDNKEVSIGFRGNDTVYDLKQKISESHSLESSSFDVIFNGIILQDAWKLRCSWLTNKTIYIVTDNQKKLANIRQEIEKLKELLDYK